MLERNSRCKWGWLGGALLALGSCDQSSPVDKLSADRRIELDRPVQASLAEAELLGEIDRALAFNQTKRWLTAERNAAWQVFHGALPYGRELAIEVEGRQIPALEYLFQGGELRGWDPRLTTDHPIAGRVGVRFPVDEGTYVGQGHVDQWLGYLSQVPVALDTPLTLGERSLTVRDWGRQSQWDVSNNPYREYSWTLIALTNLFPEEQEWRAKDGNVWTLEPLVRFEAQQKLSASTCGGMHRLMGLAHAVRYQNRLGKPFDGGWLMAKQAVEQALLAIRRYQNRDGSFSTNYTERSGVSSDFSLSLSATGHTLEFVVYAIEEEDLRSEWVQRSVRRLCAMLQASESFDLECGGVYHALSGLRIYRQRLQPKASPSK